MTFIEWLSENQGWFMLYLFTTIFIIAIVFNKFPNIPELRYNANSVLAVLWFWGWLMMAFALVTGGVWVFYSLPLWLISLAAFGIAVLLLVLTLVALTIDIRRHTRK
jgi:hypothetical protein